MLLLQGGHTDIFNAILERKDFNSSILSATNKDGYNALMLAAKEDHTDTVNAILKKSSELLSTILSATDLLGDNALMIAKIEGHTDIFKTIIRYEKDATRKRES